MHQSVLLAEAIEGLAIKPDGIYLDATFGRGGHSKAILTRLGEKGRLVTMDRDVDAVQYAHQHIHDPRFTIIHAPFSEMKEALHEKNINKVDGILMDLGVSSPQLDEARRGFSFSKEGPLDMRMDTTTGFSAAEWLSFVDESTLSHILRDYGEERFHRRIANAVVSSRKTKPLKTTHDLVDLIQTAIPFREKNKHPATRTFQAIRIFINKELNELERGLNAAVDLLKKEGRLAVISFHSLEDRIVKHFMREKAKGHSIPKEIPLREDELPKGILRIIGKAIEASQNEVNNNPRARSAILRVAEKIS